MSERQPVPNRTVLSIESGTAYLSLGLTVNGQTFARVLEVGRTAAERLPAELEALYAEAAVPMRADVIVVGTGPGSYTGLRVGASYALGLGRAWGVPVLGVSTLEALTGGGDGAVSDRVVPDGVVAVSVDARKEHVYGAVYRLAGGVVTETLQPAAKYPFADFEALASGLPWHRDGAPDPLVLAANGLHHGQREWELAYL